MPFIELKPPSCKHCGSGRRTINIKSFRKDFVLVTERILNVWHNKCCWVCKKKPVVGESWGISFNEGEKNRLYCQKCSEMVQEKILEKVGLLDGGKKEDDDRKREKDSKNNK